MRNTYRAAVGKPKGKKTLGRPRKKSEDNINTAVQLVDSQIVD
jgi:hypothetical protein